MKKPFVFVFFLVLSVIIYYPTRHAGFVHDSVSWAMQYDKFDFVTGMKEMFGDKAFHPVYHTITYFFYKYFGINSLIWYFFQVILHSSIAYFSFHFFNRFYQKSYIGFLGSLLFLLSPFQSDVVIWKATLHYLIVGFCLMKILNNYLDISEESLIVKKNILQIFLFFTIGLFSHESMIVTPLILSVFIFFNHHFLGNKFDFFKKIIAPQLSAIFLFFLGTKIYFNTWTGHYGVERHLNFSLDLIVPNFLHHFTKLFTFSHFFLEIKQKEVLINFFHQKYIVYGFPLLLVLLIFYALRHFLKAQEAKNCTLFFVLLLSIFPFLNLFVFYLYPITNDRFTYLFSIFLYPFILNLFYQLGKKVLFTAFAVYSIVSLKYLLLIVVSSWQLNDYWVRSLMKDFRWSNDKNVVVINCFDSIMGTNAFHIERKNDCAVKEYLSVYRKDLLLPDSMTQHFRYNPKTAKDIHLYHQFFEPKKFKVVIPDGTWFDLHPLDDTREVEHSDYNLKVDEWGVGLILTIKKNNQNTVFIYQQGTKWLSILTEK